MYLHRVKYHKMKAGICPSCIVVHDTVRRISSADKKVQTKDSVLLAEVTDVNEQINVGGLCFYHFRKTVSKLLVLKIPQAKKHWNSACFLCKNAKAIKCSRKANVVPGMNWLN